MFTPQLMHFVACEDVPSGPCHTPAGALLTSGYVHVIDGADLDTALGVTVSDAALRAFENGGAIVTDPDFVADGNVTINQWDRAFTDSYWQTDDHDQPLDPARLVDAARHRGRSRPSSMVQGHHLARHRREGGHVDSARHHHRRV